MGAADLLVPVKILDRAKTRLLGAADAGWGDRLAHRRLALALARDTLAAAAAACTVHRLIAVTSDPMVLATLAADEIETVPDEPDAGLNAALRHAEQLLRRGRVRRPLGALHADLPALRPAELDAALRSALAMRRSSFCPDRAGTGTTLLVAAAGNPLRPRFGHGSAAQHRADGAAELVGDWPGLRCDVDTAADLAVAGALGLGRHTNAVLRPAEA